MNCSICKEKIIDKYSHNAEPVNNGRCCSDCNNVVVIPKRIGLLLCK